MNTSKILLPVFCVAMLVASPALAEDLSKAEKEERKARKMKEAELEQKVRSAEEARLQEGKSITVLNLKILMKQTLY